MMFVRRIAIKCRPVSAARLDDVANKQQPSMLEEWINFHGAEVNTRRPRSQLWGEAPEPDFIFLGDQVRHTAAHDSSHWLANHLMGIDAVRPAVGNDGSPRGRAFFGASAAPVHSLPVKQVRLTDRFWAPKLARYKAHTIPHSWYYLAGELRALRQAAGQRVEGELNGTWGEANLYKFLETAAYSLGVSPTRNWNGRWTRSSRWSPVASSPTVTCTCTSPIQQKTPWDPGFLDGSHDGYVLGHMIERPWSITPPPASAPFSTSPAMPRTRPASIFSGRRPPGFCGHAELEMALVELYRVRLTRGTSSWPAPSSNGAAGGVVSRPARRPAPTSRTSPAAGPGAPSKATRSARSFSPPAWRTWPSRRATATTGLPRTASGTAPPCGA